MKNPIFVAALAAILLAPVAIATIPAQAGIWGDLNYRWFGGKDRERAERADRERREHEDWEAREFREREAREHEQWHRDREHEQWHHDHDHDHDHH